MGKSTDALRKISKSRRRPAAPKYPLAFLQRADLKKALKIFGVTIVKTIAVVTTLGEAGPF
jgi:hypothetical protein